MPTSAADCTVGRRQKPLLTPVEMTSASYPSTNVVAAVAAAGDGLGVQIDFGQGALDDPDRIQTTESVERDPVVAGPVAGPGQPDTEFLAADQSWFDRDTHDVEMFGEPDRGENAYIAQARDDDAFAAHAAKL